MSRRIPAAPLRPAFLRVSIASLTAAICLAPSASVADVLSQYNFGASGTSILTPTTQAPNVTASPIGNPPGAGNTFDLTNTAGSPLASAPWLRVVVPSSTSPAAAVTNNAYFQFSLAANAGFMLNMASLVFDIARGGAGTPRGYEVRTSLDNYATTVQTGAAGQARPNVETITVPLAGVAYQGISTITFRIYSYSTANGSVEYDNITTNGIAALLAFTSGYTWTGATNANWDTTTANWSGLGTAYVDASQVMFNDTGAIKDVIVSPASRAPSAMFIENSASYTFSGAALNPATVISKAGSSSATFNNTVTTASVSVSGGNLIVGPTGSLTTVSTNVGAGASLQVEAGGVFTSTGGALVNGNLMLQNGAQSLSALSGAATGVTTLTDTTLTVTGASTYSGTITGTGGLVKSGTGAFVLNGTGSNFSGGSLVTGGTLQLDTVTAGGTGGVVVNAGANLNLSANVANAITLAGGTLGASSNAVTAAPAPLTVTAPSTVKSFNAASGTTGNDIILNGLLLGTGDINLLSVNGNSPDGSAFRLRGPASTYSGTITVNPSAKFELRTGTTTSGSPMGTGTLVMVGGTPTGTGNNGTFSIVNLRNDSTGNATFGTPVRISGTGTAFFNMVGGAPAGSTTTMGALEIGNNQTAAAVSTNAAAYALEFSSVNLAGGTATFTPQLPGNTSYTAANNIRLGAISETVAGSGIRMNGAATLTLTGVNTFTGPTSLLSGTTVLAAGATLGNTSSITVAAGATFNAQPAGVFALQAPQTLSVNGTMTGDVTVAGALRGIGTVNGAVSAIAGGIVAPGNGAAGILTTTSLDLGLGSILQMELGKLSAGSPPIAGVDYDQLVVNDATGGLLATVLLEGDLSLSLGTGIQVGDVFTLIMNQGTDSIAGGFNGIGQGQIFTAGGQQFQISYGDDSSTPAFELNAGNDVSLLAVPEPGSAFLLLGGTALCAARRRRHR